MSSIHRHACAVGAVLGLFAGGNAQQPFHRFDGSADDDRFGASVQSAGDVNGDGLVDVIVGAPLNDAFGLDAGAATVYSGASGAVLYQMYGAAAGDRFGTGVSGAGDVDGDGYDDFVVGAPFDDTNGPDAGAACVFSGADGSLLRRVTGSHAGVHLGWSVAGAGDVNDDGFADFIVGAPQDDVNGVVSGSATVYSGRDGSVLFTFSGNAGGDLFGYSVAGAGDVNGDGRDDVMIGAPRDALAGTDAGSVQVRSGVDGSVLWSFLGASSSALGVAVSSAGDVNHDGFADVIAGAPLDPAQGFEAGSATVWSGADGSVLHRFDGAPGTDFGWAVASADMQADGVPDFLIGAPGIGGAGSVSIWSGADGALWKLLHGVEVGEAFGAAVAAAGDSNGDGFPDVVVGTPQGSNGGIHPGRVEEYALPPYGGQAQWMTLTPAQAGGHYGARMELVGDTNRDGVEDFAIGAPLDANTNGTVRVYSGKDLSLLWTFIGSAPDIIYGIRLTSAGDFDKDGWGDVMVAAFHEDTGAQDAGAAYIYSGKDGSILRTFYGDASFAHMGSTMGTLGDLDGDGVEDYILGMGDKNGQQGEVRGVSGQTGTILWSITGNQPGEWFGWDCAPVGDLNGDGITDYAIGAPSGTVSPTPGRGYVRITSGRDGSLIKRLDGTGIRDRFGWTLANIGDLDGDGIPELLIGSDGHDPPGKLEAGRAAVISLANYTLLYNYDGQAAGDAFGQAVGAAGDVDGDSVPDFLVGAPGADPGGVLGAGLTYLYSGKTGQQLQTFPGANLLDSMGTSMVGLGDLNGDGYGDIASCALLDDTSGIDAGAAVFYLSQPKANPGGYRNYGRACVDSTGRLPRIGNTGRPALGQTFATTLRAAPLNAPAVLGLDMLPQSIPLTFMGLPQCSLLTLHTVAVPAVTDGNGRASFSIPVPVNAPLGQFYGQWLVLDPPGVSIVLSNGVRVTIGAP